MITAELVRELVRRKEMIRNLYHDYYRHLELKEFEKASEDLWGIFNNVISMLSLLKKGRPIGRHRELGEFLDVLIHEMVSERPREADVIKRTLEEGFLACRRLHANFFHGFMDEDMFKKDREKAEALIRLLERKLHEELSKLGIAL